MERRWTGTAASIACVCALLLGLTGCSPATTEAPPDGVSVEVLQGRTDYTSGTLVIRIVNASADDLPLSHASLAVPGFAEPALWDRGTTVRAGTTVDLRTSVPEPDCDTEPGTPEVTLRVGESNSVVSATDPLGTLDRLHATGCIRVLADRIARISVGELAVEGVGAESVAVLPLILEPTGADGSVTLAGVRSTPLLRPEAGDTETWPISTVVDAASEPSTLPLRIVPARCDPHAIAEDKVGTVLVLVLAVSLSDGATGDYRLTPPEDIREALLGFVREHCGIE